MSEPLIQIVDENGKPVGAATTDEAEAQGLIQQVSRIMVEDEEGNVLLQKRTAHKGLFPDRWDNSTAGRVDAGENYLQAAYREMKEEIGLKDVELEEASYFYSSFTYEKLKVKQFQQVYRTTVRHDIKLKPDPNEVSEVKWFNRQELKALLKEPNNLTVGLAETIKRLYS